MTGIDIPIVELQLTLHQPTLKEISYVGEKEFFDGVSCLCVDKNIIQQEQSLRDTTTNFQIFMAIMQSPVEAERKYHTMQVLSLLFPNYKPMLTPRSLGLVDETGVHAIDDSNFEILQELLKKVFCLTGDREGLPEYNPQSKKAKEIAEKIMRGRQRIAEERARDGRSGSSFVQYISVLTVGLGSMSLDEIINLTIYQFQDLIERYSRYINWDIDIRARMAGAKGDSELSNWMDNIH